MHNGMLDKDFTTYTYKFGHSSVQHMYFTLLLANTYS